MLWALLWLVLVAGAVSYLVWVGLRLWRSFKALMREAERAGDLADRLNARVAELTEEAPDSPVTARIELTPAERAELWAVRGGVRAARRGRREGRWLRASARWRQIIGAPAHVVLAPERTVERSVDADAA